MSENPPGRPLTTLRAALNAGLLAGFLLGLADGVVAGVRTGARGLHDWVGCLAASAAVYGLVAVALLLLLSPVTHFVLRRRDLLGRLRFQLGLALGVGMFFDLYWWTRPFVLWGVPATDPRRLAAAAGLLLVGLALGFAVASGGARLSARAKWIGALLVPLTFLGGLGYLATAGGVAAERGRINARNRHLPNVLIFVVDALRADVLGAYGSERVETPVIDGLAARGVLFESAYVQAPFTWSSFGSILTGKYPRRHGLVKMAPGYVMPENITLASHLKSARMLDGRQLIDTDFVGATFMTGTLSHGSGLLHGFDTYFEAMVGHPLVEVDNPWSVFKSELVLSRVHMKLIQRYDDTPVANTAVSWFRQNGQRRFVAMVHYYSTHTPYDPPARFRKLYVDPAYDGPIDSFYAGHRIAIEAGAQTTEADRAQIRNLYYAGVTQADAMIGQVLDELERQQVLDQTLVIVTADHGEELGDHGLWEHNFMYQTNLRVPLVMTLSGALPAGVRVGALVETVDLVPTVCELLGLEPPLDPALTGGAGEIDGVSLMPLVRGEIDQAKPFAFAENGLYVAIQDIEWKLVVRARALGEEGWAAMLAGEHEQAQLYHLTQDPGERTNVFERHRDQAERLVMELRAWDAGLPIGREEIVVSDRDRELEQRLDSLGYTESGVGHGDE